MPVVNDNWTKTINDPYFRREIELEAYLLIEDLELRNTAVIIDNGHLPYSNTEGLVDRKRTAAITATAETGMYILNGITETEEDIIPYQGFAGVGVSGIDKTFGVIWNYVTDGTWILGEKPFATGSVDPEVEIIGRDNSYDLAGLYIAFDPINNDYATEFSIDYFYYDTLVKHIYVTDNASPYFQSTERVDNINRIKLMFTKTFNENRRIRITDIVFGLNRVFYGRGETSIRTMDRTLWISPIMKEIPKNSLTFTVQDEYGEYNPQDPSGIWRYTTRGQELGFRYNLPVETVADDGTVIETQETYHESKMYLTGRPSTKSRSVTFTSSGKLQQLTQMYNASIYREEGRTYYDLFKDLFTFEDWPLYRIPEELKNHRCFVPLPNSPTNALMQQLCQTILYIITEDVDGYINIRKSNSETMNYNLERISMKDYPEYQDPIPQLRNLIIPNTQVSVDPETKELHKSTIEFTGTIERFIDYDASTNQIAAVTAGGEILSAEYFAYGCRLTLRSYSGTIEVAITGNPLIFTTDRAVYPVNDIGEDAVVNLSLLSSSALREEIAPLYAAYLQEGDRYTLNYLGDPALIANDIPVIQTRFDDALPAQIISSKYSYNNGSKGTLELKNYGTKRQPYIR